MGLSGVWYNQLNSRMTLEDDGKGGLTGQYSSAVGECPTGLECSLIGAYDTSPSGAIAVGFVVAWSTEFGSGSSVTAWSGQYDPDRDMIMATWLLTGQGVGQSPWNSTLVGQDWFSRDPHAEDVVDRYFGGGAASHPMPETWAS
jgi:hypothetical protein